MKVERGEDTCLASFHPARTDVFLGFLFLPTTTVYQKSSRSHFDWSQLALISSGFAPLDRPRSRSRARCKQYHSSIFVSLPSPSNDGPSGPTSNLAARKPLGLLSASRAYWYLFDANGRNSLFTSRHEPAGPIWSLPFLPTWSDLSTWSDQRRSAPSVLWVGTFLSILSKIRRSSSTIATCCSRWQTGRTEGDVSCD